MLLPALNNAREKAKEAARTGNQEAIQLVTNMYHDLYNDYYPTLDAGTYRQRTSCLADVMGMKRLLQRDSTTGLMSPIDDVTPQLAGVFLCPSDEWHRKASTQKNILLSYGYNDLMSHQVGNGEKPEIYAFKRGMVRHPSRKIYVGDVMAVDKNTLAFKGSTHSPFVRNGYPFTILPTYEGGMHFRHRNYAVIGYADGHVGTQPFKNIAKTDGTWVMPRW